MSNSIKKILNKIYYDKCGIKGKRANLKRMEMEEVKKKLRTDKWESGWSRMAEYRRSQSLHGSKCFCCFCLCCCHGRSYLCSEKPSLEKKKPNEIRAQNGSSSSEMEEE